MSEPVFDNNSPTTLWTLLNEIVTWAKRQLSRRGTAVAAGTVLGGGTGASIAVTFPAGRFSEAPLVVAALVSASGSHNYNAVRVYNVTTTGCSLLVSNGASGSYSWIAVQP